MFGMMGMFTLVIGLFTLYSAVTGKGPAYKADHPKEMKESNQKLLRTFMWILSPLLIAQGAIDLTDNNLGWLSTTLYFVIIAILIVYGIIFFKRYGAILKKQREEEKNVNKSL